MAKSILIIWGRLILLKYVSTLLPVYALSFFKAPSGIISLIESIFFKKNWGGNEDNRKMSWIVGVPFVYRRRKEVWGVRRLKEFNTALLGRWCWRMLVERGRLWYRVLVVRYGEEAGRVEVGGRSTSPWWREIAKIRDGVGENDGGWFAERVSKVIGDGNDAAYLRISKVSIYISSP